MPLASNAPWRALSYPFALRLAFPWIDAHPILGCLGLAATIAGLMVAPPARRRTALPAVVFIWIVLGASFSFAVVFAVGAWLQAFILRSRLSLTFRLGAVAVVGAALLAESRSVGGFAGVAAWHLGALTMIRGVSAAVDADEEGATWREMLLYLSGGLPASFLGAYHGFAVFRRAEKHARPLATDWSDVGAGVLWLVAAATLRAAAKNLFAPTFDPAAFSVPGLWLYSGAMLAGEVSMWMGAYRVIEGLSRLCGYDLPSQFERPWLSDSILDFWRRYSRQNRAFLLQYVLFPASRWGAGPASGVALVFAVSAVLNSLRFAGVSLADGGWRSVAGEATMFALFFAAFGSAAVLEIVISRAFPRRRNSRVAAVAAAVVLVLIWAPLEFWPKSASADPKSVAERWLSVELRLLGRPVASSSSPLERAAVGD